MRDIQALILKPLYLQVLMNCELGKEVRFYADEERRMPGQSKGALKARSSLEEDTF